MRQQNSSRKIRGRKVSDRKIPAAKFAAPLGVFIGVEHDGEVIFACLRVNNTKFPESELTSKNARF